MSRYTELMMTTDTKVKFELLNEEMQAADPRFVGLRGRGRQLDFIFQPTVTTNAAVAIVESVLAAHNADKLTATEQATADYVAEVARLRKITADPLSSKGDALEARIALLELALAKYDAIVYT